MKTLIICDSYFGNTQKIAEAISNAIPKSKLINVKDFKQEDLKDIELLIVGSPTRAFSPSENTTAFLKTLPELGNIKVGAFDTGISPDDISSKILKLFIKLFGYASPKISKALIKKGGIKILEPETFFVQENEGPLKEGEIERAKDWVKKIS
jgi:flavodoxin